MTSSPASTPDSNTLIARQLLAFVEQTYDKRRKNFGYHLERLNLTDNSEAESIFAETIIKCYDTICKSGLGDLHFATYFDTAARNNLINFNIKQQRNVTITFEDYNGDNGDSATLEENTSTCINVFSDNNEAENENEKSIQALVAFDTLPQKLKKVLLMRSNGMKYSEISRVLGLTEGQTKMRIKTARDLIKKAMKGCSSNR
jgi:RNA polymerase sigma factor (sigma-70 family)